jgi:hypothetical protein
MTNIVEARMIAALLILAAFIFAGTLVELVLEEHNKETLQYVPFILCILGLLVILAVLRRPARPTVLAMRWSMLLIAGGGLLGVGLHLYKNFVFEQEIRPNAELADLLLRTLKGANPLVAPGILSFAAIMVLIATYYHPALEKQQEA